MFVNFGYLSTMVTILVNSSLIYSIQSMVAAKSLIINELPNFVEGYATFEKDNFCLKFSSLCTKRIKIVQKDKNRYEVGRECFQGFLMSEFCWRRNGSYCRLHFPEKCLFIIFISDYNWFRLPKNWVDAINETKFGPETDSDRTQMGPKF